jgi:hypothetical protein
VFKAIAIIAILYLGNTETVNRFSRGQKRIPLYILRLTHRRAQGLAQVQAAIALVPAKIDFREV